MNPYEQTNATKGRLLPAARKGVHIHALALPAATSVTRGSRIPPAALGCKVAAAYYNALARQRHAEDFPDPSRTPGGSAAAVAGEP